MESWHLQRTLRCTGLIAFAIARGLCSLHQAQPPAAGGSGGTTLCRGETGTPPAGGECAPGAEERPRNRFRGPLGQGAAVAYAVEAGAGSLRRRRAQPSITRPIPTRSSEPGVGTLVGPLR